MEFSSVKLEWVEKKISVSRFRGRELGNSALAVALAFIFQPPRDICQRDTCHALTSSAIDSLILSSLSYFHTTAWMRRQSPTDLAIR